MMLCVSLIITLELLHAVPVRHYWPGGGPGPGVWEGGHAEDDAAIQVSHRRGIITNMWHY